MAGQRELLIAIPPVLLTMQVPAAIGSQTMIPLADARIAGSKDPTFGSVTWTGPRLDDKPFAFIMGGKTAEKQYETARVRTVAAVHIFLAIAESNVPNVATDFNDLGLAWRDELRLVIPQNRRLYPASATLFPTAGDVIWEFSTSDIVERHDILGVSYYGVDCLTTLSFTTIVQFQG